ncbi:MAG: hypothetical protein NUW37_11440 [Planctomycetes bacterium]|nr:hypothetical protein [Planctomycetota bacterium]
MNSDFKDVNHFTSRWPLLLFLLLTAVSCKNSEVKPEQTNDGQPVSGANLPDSPESEQISQQNRNQVQTYVDNVLAPGEVTIEDREKLELALTALGEKRYQQALALLNELCAKFRDTGWTEPHIWKAQVYYRLGNTSEEMISYYAALHENPYDYDVHRLLANLLLGQREFRAAVEHYDFVIEVNRTAGIRDSLAEYNRLLCLTYLALSGEDVTRTDFTIAQWEEFIRNNPDFDRIEVCSARLVQLKEKFPPGE